MKVLGRFITKRRTGLNMSKSSLAARSGISYATICKLEKAGRLFMHQATAVALAKVFAMSAEALIEMSRGTAELKALTMYPYHGPTKGNQKTGSTEVTMAKKRKKKRKGYSPKKGTPEYKAMLKRLEKARAVRAANVASGKGGRKKKKKKVRVSKTSSRMEPVPSVQAAKDAIADMRRKDKALDDFPDLRKALGKSKSETKAILAKFDNQQKQINMLTKKIDVMYKALGL